MELFVQETGQRGAPAIVFLHGGGASGWTWQKQTEYFSDYHCLVPDLPEHGRSASVGPLTLDGAAELVMQLIQERVPGGKAHVVGLSLGGQIGCHLLARHSQVVESALLSGTLALEMPGAGWMRSSAAKKWIQALLEAYMPHRLEKFWIWANMKGYRIPAEFEAQFREDTRLLSVDLFMRMILEENLGFQVPAGLEGAHCPVLCLAGKKEYGVMQRSVKHLARLLPNAKAGVVSGVWHNWPVENSGLFNSTLGAWLEGKELPQEVKLVI